MSTPVNYDVEKGLKDFGRRLAAKRMEARITKQVFAKKCGISYKHYFNIESGDARPSLLAYIAICRVLGLTLPMVD